MYTRSIPEVGQQWYGNGTLHTVFNNGCNKWKTQGPSICICFNLTYSYIHFVPLKNDIYGNLNQKLFVTVFIPVIYYRSCDIDKYKMCDHRCFPNDKYCFRFVSHDLQVVQVGKINFKESFLVNCYLSLIQCKNIDNCVFFSLYFCSINWFSRW